MFMSFFCVNVKAQKVDLDRFYFNVKYQNLPQEPVPFEKRTFSSKVKLGGVFQTYVNPTDVNSKLYIYGWKRVEENATVDVLINLEDFVEKSATQKTRIDEKKDKDGRVTFRKEYYYVVSTYTTRGFAKIKGPITPIPPTEKEIEEAKAKEAAVSTNRFLKNAIVKKDTTKAVTDGFRINFDGEVEYVSKEYEDPSEPLKEFYVNKTAIRDRKLREFTVNASNRVISDLGSTYGFTNASSDEILWILDAKNDEGKTQMEAIQAVKALFATTQPALPIDDLKSNMQPLIEYLESLKTKYADDSKPSRKMRYSAYYNLATIYLMMDEPEKAIVESEKLIANDYDKADGKLIIERANKLIASFKRAKTNTRHNPVLK